MVVNDSSNLNTTALTISGATIQLNEANDGNGGGAIYAYRANVVVEDGLISSNTANGGNANGGAFAIDGGILTINGGRILQNDATKYGKAIWVSPNSDSGSTDSYLKVLGGQIVSTNCTYNSTIETATVHMGAIGRKTSTLYVGNDARIFGSTVKNPSTSETYDFNVYLEDVSPLPA